MKDETSVKVMRIFFEKDSLEEVTSKYELKANDILLFIMNGNLTYDMDEVMSVKVL